MPALLCLSLCPSWGQSPPKIIPCPPLLPPAWLKRQAWWGLRRQLQAPCCQGYIWMRSPFPEAAGDTYTHTPEHRVQGRSLTAAKIDAAWEFNTQSLSSSAGSALKLYMLDPPGHG